MSPLLSSYYCFIRRIAVLFRINLQVQETQPGELWSDNVHKLLVNHETEGLLGYIYCDFYQR